MMLIGNHRLKPTLVALILLHATFGYEYIKDGQVRLPFSSQVERQKVNMPEIPQTKPKEITMYQWETHLLQYLFIDGNYNPEARPAIVNSTPVTVRLDMVLLKINELNWTDVRLSWKKEDFGGMEWIVTQSSNVWLPDIALINSNDVYSITRDSRFPVTVSSDGHVLFVPAGKIYARCELDLRFFPFDWQICNYRFESWVYSADSVTINGLNFTIDPNHYVQNHQWDIIDSFVLSPTITYENYSFSRVEFYIYLRRKSLFFITYTIFPCLALSTLQIFSHMLPFTESERINFATTTLIAFSVFHVSIVEQMPQSSESIPLLAIYVDSLMILIGLSLIECFVMMNWLSKVEYTVPSPLVWYWVVERWGDYMCLGSAGMFWRKNYLKIFNRVNTQIEKIAEQRRLRHILNKKDKGDSIVEEEASIMLDQVASTGHIRRFTKLEESILKKMAFRWKYDTSEILHIPLRPRKTMRTFKDSSSVIDIPSPVDQSNVPGPIPYRQSMHELRSQPSRRESSISGSASRLPPKSTSTLVIRDRPGSTFLEPDPMTWSSESRKGRKHSESPKLDSVDPLIVLDYMANQEPRASAPVRLRNEKSTSRGSLRRGVPSQSFRDALYSPIQHRNEPHREMSAGSSMRRPKYVAETSLSNQRKPGANREEILIEIDQKPHRCSKHQHQHKHRKSSETGKKLSPSPTSRPKCHKCNCASSMHDPKMTIALNEIYECTNDISSAIISHELKRECIGIWTIFITVIDRIMSLLLLLLCISMPTYLFLIFPQPLDISYLKSGAQYHR